MSAVSNAFDALSTKSKKAKASASTEDQQLQNEIQIAITEPVSIEAPSNDDTTWIVQSSAKRRLAPQYVLSKNDLGVDSPKNKASQQEMIKKKVLRFTKDEILALRVETKVLASLVELSDIVSVAPLPPATSLPFDFEDFNRIWNADRINNIQKDGGRGRGRGRGRPGDENGENTDGLIGSGSSGSGGHNQWNRGNNREDDMWDSSNDMASNAAPIGFDLSDFAAAALQFRNQTKELINNEKNGSFVGNGDLSYGDQKQQEDDAMARLLEEQLSLDGLENHEEEEDVPDWAKDDGEPVIADTKIISADSKIKRNLLLETLNVKVPLASSGSKQISETQLETTEVIADTAVILPKSTAPNTSTSQTPFSFQFDDNNAKTGTNITTNVALTPVTDISGNGFSQSLTFTKSPTQSLESTYLSTINLSDVLGKSLPPTSANAIAPLSSFPIAMLNNQLPPPIRPPQQVVDEWEYLDPQNEVQGPFASKNMRRWLEIGYFKMDLPIRLRSWSRFYPLGRLYPNLEFAFQQLLPEPGTSDVQSQNNNNAIELQRRQQQAAMEQQKLQQLNLEQRQQQALLEQQKQQAVMEQQRKQQALAEQQRQQQLIIEQRQQHALLEQQRQQQVAILEQRQQQALFEQRQLEHRQQQALLEQRQQQALLEQRQQQALLEQRQQHALLEQRQQQVLLEQKQQQALIEQRQHQANLDHQRQQALVEQHLEQQRYQALLEQQRQQRQMAEAANKGSPWNTASSSTHKSLAEIQIEEEAKQQQAMQHQAAVQQTQSSKLKSFLGMASGVSDGGSSIKGWNNSDSHVDASNSPAFKTSAKSLKEIQQEEQQELSKQQQLLLQQQQQYQKRLKQQQQQDEELAAAKVLPLSWNNPSATGGAKTAASTNQPSKTSLKDIMKEEAKSEPTRDPVTIANSWASKTKSAAPAPASQLQSSNVLQQSSPRSNASQQVSDRKSSNEKPVTNSNDFTTATTTSTTSTVSSNKSEFGGKGMSSEFAEFCTTSMQRLNGNDDITLLQFCMSLKSPAEIREYLAAYLGSKPEVSQFATEFIKRRETGGNANSANAVSSAAVVQGSNNNGNADKKILKKKK